VVMHHVKEDLAKLCFRVVCKHHVAETAAETLV
jgi:hypothetical protein